MRPRDHLSYANIMATFAVFIALGGTSWAATEITGRLTAGSVTSREVKNNSLSGQDLRDRSVTARDLADSSVTGRQIQDGSLTVSDFAAGQLPRGEQGPKGERGPQGERGPAGAGLATPAASDLSGSWPSLTLREDVVTTGKLARESVTSSRIADGAVDTQDLARNAVTGGRIAPGAVDSAELANGSVTPGKLAVGAVASYGLAPSAVTSTKIASGAVGTQELNENAVTLDKLSGDVAPSLISRGLLSERPAASAANNGFLYLAYDQDGGTLYRSNGAGWEKTGASANASGTGTLADGSVTTAKLADDAVTTDKLGDSAVGTAQLADAAVTAAKLSDDVASALISRGALTDRPAASATNDGSLYLAYDQDGGTLYRSNGTSWEKAAAGASATTGDAAGSNVTLNPVTSDRNVVQAANGAVTPLTARSAAGQTADLQQWQNSNGDVLASITSNGRLAFPTGAALSSPSNNTLAVSGAMQVAGQVSGGQGSFGTAGSPTQVALRVRGAASQTADLQQWRNNAGDVLASINSSGKIQGWWGADILNGLQTYTTVPSITPIVAKGAAGQTAHLQEWQDSAGAAKAAVTSSGQGQFAGVLSSANQGSTFRVTSAGAVPLTVQGAPGQTAGLQAWLDSSGTTVASFGSNGVLYTMGGVAAPNVRSSNGTPRMYLFNSGVVGAEMRADTATLTPALIKGAAGQTADLTVWQNSSAGTLARVDADGAIHTNATIDLARGAQAGVPNGVLALGNVPSAPPAPDGKGGGFLYVEGGALKFRGAGGTVTTIAGP